MKGELFFDSNVVCYAYDLTERTKREACKRLVERAFVGEIHGVISNQVLIEIYNTLSRKFGLPKEQVRVIVKSLITSKNWRKVDYDCNTVESAIATSDALGTPFLDSLIYETMRENDVEEIVTENERDFGRMEKVKVMKPF